MADENPGRLYPVKIEAYNSKWPVLFEKEKAYLLNLFGKNLACEHIGSTAVKGLSAKPTIDLLLEDPPGVDESEIIRIMEDNSYIYMKEQTRHLMFVKGYTSTGLEEESYHIHIGPLFQSWLWDRIFFRDYLIENPREANNYEILKKELASKYKYDRDLYTDGKEEYVKMITDKAKFEMNKNTESLNWFSKPSIKKINIIFLIYNILPWALSICLAFGNFPEETGFRLFFTYLISLLPGILLIWPIFLEATVAEFGVLIIINILSQLINFIIFNAIVAGFIRTYNFIKKKSS